MMLGGESDVGTIGELIRLAMAPAFLLVAAGNILGLFAGRLARVVDRQRSLRAEFPAAPASQRREIAVELRVLNRRAAVVNFAILMGTLSAVVVGLLIAVLFVTGFTAADLGYIVSGGFILAMALLIAGLTGFVVEIRLASKHLRVREALTDLDN